MGSLAGKRHITKRFPGTPSYITRQRSCALPFHALFAPQSASRRRGLSMRAQGVSPLCFQFPKTRCEITSSGKMVAGKFQTNNRAEFLFEIKKLVPTCSEGAGECSNPGCEFVMVAMKIKTLQLWPLLPGNTRLSCRVQRHRKANINQDFLSFTSSGRHRSQD